MFDHLMIREALRVVTERPSCGNLARNMVPVSILDHSRSLVVGSMASKCG